MLRKLIKLIYCRKKLKIRLQQPFWFKLFINVSHNDQFLVAPSVVLLKRFHYTPHSL